MSSGRNGSIDSVWLCAACRMSSHRWETSSVSTHAAYSARTARTIVAALDPGEFPLLTSQIDVIADSMAEREVFRLGLRNLITAAAGSLRAQ